MTEYIHICILTLCFQEDEDTRECVINDKRHKHNKESGQQRGTRIKQTRESEA